MVSLVPKELTLTPARWEKAKKVLLGEHGRKVSVYSAAKAADITLKELDYWVNRSRQRDPTDDPWIWKIAEVFDESPIAQAGTLEDVAWDHSINGTPKSVIHQGEIVGQVREFDHTLLMKVLKARDQKYIEKTANLNVNVNADVDLDILEKKWEAMRRMKEAKEELIIDAKGSVIVQDTEMDDTGMFDPDSIAAIQKQDRSLKNIKKAPDLSEFDDW